jgi:hypothetical protein
VINYLDLLKAGLQEKTLPDEVPKVPKAPSNAETRPPNEVPKVPEPPFGTSQGRHVSQTRSRWLDYLGPPPPGRAATPTLPDRTAEATERAASIPRGYTRAELEAARLDARRLGYSGHTVH